MATETAWVARARRMAMVGGLALALPIWIAAGAIRADDPTLPVPLAALTDGAPSGAVEANAPSIDLEVVEAKPRAGMRVHVKAITRGLGPKKKLRWTWPDDEIDGVKFSDPNVVHLSELGRVVEIVWPRGGTYTIECKAHVVTNIERDEQGNVIDFEPEEVKATLVLDLAGGVGPAPQPGPPLPTPPADLHAACAPLATLLPTVREKCGPLADLHRDLRDLLLRDATAKRIKNVGQVAAAIQTAGHLLLQPNDQPTPVGQALGTLMIAQFGSDTGKSLDDPHPAGGTLRDRHSVVFQAIEYTCREAAK